MQLAYLIRSALSGFVQSVKRPRQFNKLKDFVQAEMAGIKDLPLQAGKDKEGTLIIKCDDIGDFLIWQQTIPTIREKAQKPLSFVGNIVNRVLVETYFDFADHYIWIDKSKWGEGSYRMDIYRQVRALQVKTAMTTLFTRNNSLDDMILLASAADERIAWDMSHHAYFPELAGMLGPVTTKTITSHKKTELEYFRNLEFISAVFAVALPRTFKPLFPGFDKQNRLVVVPVASAPSKCWDTFNYAEVIRQVAPQFDAIFLLGGKDSIEACRTIESACQEPKIMNFAGQTSLNELIPFIGESRLLLCPDTFALHTAVLTATDVVLLTNGTNWQRFSDYSAHIPSKIKVIYPLGFKPDADKVKTVYSRSEINAIMPETVIRAIREITG